MSAMSRYGNGQIEFQRDVSRLQQAGKSVIRRFERPDTSFAIAKNLRATLKKAATKVCAVAEWNEEVNTESFKEVSWFECRYAWLA